MRFKVRRFTVNRLQPCTVCLAKLLTTTENTGNISILSNNRPHVLLHIVLKPEFRKGHVSTACCPNPFSLGLKRFLTNLRLATGDVKTRPPAQTVDIADLPLRQDLLAKKRFNDRSKEFLFGQRPVKL